MTYEHNSPGSLGDEATSSRLLEEGLRQYNARSFYAAIRTFEEAFREHADWRALSGQALSWAMLGNCVRALQLVDRMEQQGAPADQLQRVGSSVSRRCRAPTDLQTWGEEPPAPAEVPPSFQQYVTKPEVEPEQPSWQPTVDVSWFPSSPGEVAGGFQAITNEAQQYAQAAGQLAEQFATNEAAGVARSGQPPITGEGRVGDPWHVRYGPHLLGGTLAVSAIVLVGYLVLKPEPTT